VTEARGHFPGDDAVVKLLWLAIINIGWDLWELTPFYCPDCQLNYCSGGWDTWVQSHDGFYNCTKGRCPNRHEHMLDD
jgi:hypothetical protein